MNKTIELLTFGAPGKVIGDTLHNLKTPHDVESFSRTGVRSITKPLGFPVNGEPDPTKVENLMNPEEMFVFGTPHYTFGAILARQ